MLLFLSLLLFLMVISLGIAIIGWQRRSPLVDRLERKKEQPEPETNFFDVLWNINPVLRKESFRYGLYSAMAAFTTGVMFTPLAALVFAGAAFVMVPRIKQLLDMNRRRKRFFKQFPRAVSELAAVAKTGTLLDGFRLVEKEHPAPVADVFGYIAKTVDSGTTAHKAVFDAVEQFGYPGLDRLGEAVRVINELGGGEKAGETLNSAADHIRFLERFRNKVDAAVGGIIYEMLLATGIILLYFLLTSGPWTEGWENVRKHPMVVLTGLLAIGIGWYLGMKKISKFKNKNYIS
ncbi:hypothetical protein DCCM_4589 [Desulfocucumis palustris]|uniref:Type II secretion system protein GspF domain-containing protein n=1 Tax=Desulfocucumis palustris TaxID=1898651 RepID=A0A2L2XH40_9FIRM|nr:type II secretion system F family protein [Desulfocucumis palustris]GBF35460.1 hypothetical protein DCCM_4589 [Desulfocucumis palustris]